MDDFGRVKGVPKNYHKGRAARNILDLIRSTCEQVEEVQLEQ